METTTLVANLLYLVSIVCFTLGIKRLGKVKTARSANSLAAFAMLAAIVGQLIELDAIDPTMVIGGAVVGSLIGIVLAMRVEMTAMPELVAVFNGFGGAASTLVALSLFYATVAGHDNGVLSEMEFDGVSGMGAAISLALSVIIGAVTFSGSLIAFGKLSEQFGRYIGKAILFPGRHLINAGLAIGILFLAVSWMSGVGIDATPPEMSANIGLTITILALLLGVLLVLPIGGADMPVVISLLNSYSGMAACATGFALNSNVLIVSGALVGASGIILTQIMCKAMNRSLANVMFGGFGADAPAGDSKDEGYNNVKSADPEEAALDFSDAQSVIIIPGYGLAVSQGQNAVREFADQLKERGCNVKYAIHPVAGRMPGHMNVLLAESNVPYDELFEMDEINNEFQSTDIAIVVGANDVVNPAAKEDPNSPLYGMPVLNVEEARQVFVIKRSLGAGFAGVKNILFEKDNTRMIYGDAKKVLEELTSCIAEED